MRESPAAQCHKRCASAFGTGCRRCTFATMTVEGAPGGRSRNLVLAAMIFAVSMTFIDQTIVSIAVPQIQRQLGLTSTGIQWMVNAYLLSLAALFAFGGRLADTG